MRGGEKIYVYIYYKYRVSCVRFDNWFRLGKKKKKNLTKKKTTIQQYLDTRNTHTVETTTRPLPPLFRFPRGERIILITRSGRRKTKNNPKHEKSRHCRALHPSHNRRSIDIIEGLNPLNPSLRTNTPTIAQVHRRWCAHAAMCVTACRISGPFYNCYDRRGRTTFQRRPDLNATSRTNPDNSPPGAPFTFFSSAILLSLPPLSLSLWSNIYSIKSHRSSVTFFNFISSSCFPFFSPSLSFFPTFCTFSTVPWRRGLAKEPLPDQEFVLNSSSYYSLSHGKKEAFYLASPAESITGAEHGNRFSPLRNLLDIPLPSSSRTLGKLVSVFINVAMCLPGGKFDGILSRNV